MSVLTDIRHRGTRDVFFLVCDGLKAALLKRAGTCRDLPDDVNERIDCLAGLRSDVTVLSGALAKIALPALNRWNGFSE